MQVNVETKRTAKSLDEGHGAGGRLRPRQSGLADQVRADGADHDPRCTD